MDKHEEGEKEKKRKEGTLIISRFAFEFVCFHVIQRGLSLRKIPEPKPKHWPTHSRGEVGKNKPCDAKM